MKRYRLFAISILIVICVFVTAMISYGTFMPLRIYSVTDVERGLQRNPRFWAKQVIYVRGWIAGLGTFRICPLSTVSTKGCFQTTWSYWEPRNSHHVYAIADMVGGAPPTTVSGLGQRELRIVVPGPSPRSYYRWLSSAWIGPLPSGFYSLPILGPLLSNMFPGHAADTQIARVRLASPYSCTGLMANACPDGTLLPP